MSRTRGRANPQRSVRLVWLLIGSFALTIASFVATTLLSEHRSRGIQTAAQSITANAVPSVACYSRARTDLRQIEMFLERLTAGVVLGRTAGSDAATLRQTRDNLAQQWRTCTTLPKYPDEEGAQQRITAQVGELDVSIDHVLDRLDRGDRVGASAELYAETEPMLDRLDDEIIATIDLNVHNSTLLADHISKLREASGHTMTVLLTVSTILTVTAAVIMVRVLRRFTHLMESRVTEMEHFAGRVAHDIRSPLSAVGIALELTKRNPELGLTGGVIDRATRTVQRIGQLVDGLLVFARAGACSPEGSEADVAPVVDGVVEEMRPLAESSGIALDVERPAVTARVACTPGVLISLLSNLVGNALKHMGSSPIKEVHIRTREVDGLVRFEVHDTGPGIPAAMRERIFDPYVRAAASATPGLGLGLATVRRLAETHGGSVGVVPGKAIGSMFWFEIPKAGGEPRAAKRFTRQWIARLRAT